MNEDDIWRKCSTCKKPIGFSTHYWVCNVSTCNRQPNSFVFCSVDCWDAHVPTMRHKESWAEEQTSPGATAAVKTDSEVSRPAAKPTVTLSEKPSQPRSVVINRINQPARSVSPSTPAGAAPAAPTHLSPPPPDEILAVASKVKAYIKARSGLNTSAGVMEALSDKIRVICDRAIHSALQHERKTVLDRDVH